MWGGFDPNRSPPAGSLAPRGQGVLRAGGGGGASLARLARAPRFPGVTCESPPATSSALFLFTFPARRQPAALLSAGTPRRGRGRAQPVPRTLPHPRWDGQELAPPPREVPSARPPRAATAPHPTGGMLRPGRPLCSPPLPASSHWIRARTPGTIPLQLCPGFPPRAPSRGRLSPRGGFQVGPCPCPHTRTHTQRPPNDRQGLEKGWGVFTVPQAASAGPDAAPGRSPPPPPPALPSLPGHPRRQRGGGQAPREGGN